MNHLTYNVILSSIVYFKGLETTPVLRIHFAAHDNTDYWFARHIDPDSCFEGFRTVSKMI